MGDITEQKPSKRRRILLRLDDGSLIGESAGFFGYTSSGAAILDYEQAYRLGKAGQKDVDRLQKLIKQYASRNNGVDPHALKPSTLKPYNPYTHDGLRALKRQKSVANGDVLHAVASPEGAPVFAGDFTSKCWDVLNKVYGAMGPREEMFNVPAKDIFYKTVSESFPSLAANYYTIIRNPITFKEIEDRLNSSAYTQPQQFAEDMRLLFQNCRVYNINAADPVRKLGERLSDAFEQAWAASGLCSDARAKRATAGVAAAKFEPDDDQLQPPSKTKSHSRGQQPPARNGQRPGDGGHTFSHEVSSYQDDMAGVEVEQQQHPEQEALLQEVADAIAELEDPEPALGLFNPGVVTTTPDGEVELDFGVVTMDALIKVDTFIRKQKGLPPREFSNPLPAAAAAAVAAAPAGAAAAARPAAAPAPSAGRRGARVVESDSDFEEDDSDSDDD